MGLYLVVVCATGQYNTITHNTQNNTRNTNNYKTIKANLSMSNYKKKSGTHILHKTQKRVQPKVNESVLKTTRYIKQFLEIIDYLLTLNSLHFTSLTPS